MKQSLLLSYAPKITVIIPVYNMENFLNDCLMRVVYQTIFQDIEVICINDYSTDSSKQILENYSIYKNFVIVNQTKNLGVSEARNLGIKLAKGTYVAFLDPDDFYPDNRTLENLFNSAIETGAKICGGSFSDFSNKTHSIKTKYEGIYSKYTFKKKSMISYKDYQFDYGFHRFIYNRNFLLTNNIVFPPFSRFQDPPFFVKAMISANEFLALPVITYRYRFGHQNTNWDSKKICDLVKGLTENLKLSSKYGLNELHKLTFNRFKSQYFGIISNALEKNIPELPSLLTKAELNIKQNLFDTEDSYKSLWTIYGNHNAKTNSIRKKYEEQIRQIKNSRTYRYGYYLLYVPKKMKFWLKKLSNIKVISK